MTAYEWQEVIGVIGMFALLILVVTVTIWQIGATARTKAILKQAEEHRALAETSFKAHAETREQLSELKDSVGDIQSRMANLERILKEVD